MTTLTASIGAILDNFADAIEGGNSYRGSGTAYKGIPSTRSFDDLETTGLNATAGSTTTATIGAVDADEAGYMVREYAPPFFLLCTAQAAGSGNTGAARKITQHDGTDTFTVAPAFAETVASGDTFSIAEGFKRMRDIVDVESDDGIAGGLDRIFSLDMLPGKRLPIYGNGYEWHESTMDLYIRIHKKGRERTARQAILENAQQMRTILTRLDVRGDYVQLVDVLDSQPEIFSENKDRITIRDRYRVKYRVDASYK